MQKSILKVINLSKSYNREKPVIKNLNFEVCSSEIHAFIGANGAGKTTTIKSIVGAYSDYSGEILINGISNRNPEAKKSIGYVPEISKFPARISAYKYLYYMSLLNKMTKSQSKEYVEYILKKFQMWNLKDRSPNSFSSGQKKKILLAQALSNNPDLIVMDEPTANLDPNARLNFFDILKELKKDGKSVLISSHILSELDQYSDAVTILDDGKIAYTNKIDANTLSQKKYVYFFKIKQPPKLFTELKNIKLSEKHEFVKEFNSIKDVNKFSNFLISKDLLIKMEKYTLNISDLYKKYVVMGSVETKNKV